MPKTKVAELDFGPVWDELVARLGNPFDGQAPHSKPTSFRRKRKCWQPFSSDADWTLTWPWIVDEEPPTEWPSDAEAVDVINAVEDTQELPVVSVDSRTNLEVTS